MCYRIISVLRTMDNVFLLLLGIWLLWCCQFIAFICCLFLLTLYMWGFSDVFICFHFICFVSVIVAYVWPLFSIRLEYPELPLLSVVASMCLLCVAWNIHPMYHAFCLVSITSALFVCVTGVLLHFLFHFWFQVLLLLAPL